MIAKKFVVPPYKRPAGMMPARKVWLEERKAAWYWIKNLEAAGFSPHSVFDGDRTVLVPGALGMLDEICGLDESHAYFADGSGKKLCVFFVFGNSPAEVAADMSVRDGPWSDAVEAISNLVEEVF